MLTPRQRALNKKKNDHAHYTRRRDAVFELLGGKCPCGYRDPRALQIDHRNGGGTRHRKEGGSWPKLFADVRRHPSKYRLLCANCNSIARIENGQHRKPKK